MQTVVTPTARNPDIRPDLRFFFVHVMKTGGTTFRFHLRANFAPDEVYPYREIETDMLRAYTSIPYLRAQPPTRRRSARCFAAHLPAFVADELGEELGQSLVVMTILRDPIERLLSHLEQLRDADATAPEADLEAVYDREPRAREQQLQNLQVRFFALEAHDRSESFLDPVPLDDDRLRAAKDRLDRVDVLGLHDHYAEFLRELERRFGWRFTSIPDQRVGGSREVSRSFRRRLERDNAADLEFYAHARAEYEARAASSARSTNRSPPEPPIDVGV